MRQSTSFPADPATAVRCDLAGEVLRSFGSLRFVGTGWSMLPAIWPGDTLMVERVPQDRFRIGDVVLVGREGRLCAHRLISRTEVSGSPHCITQGDAMSRPDPPVLENELLGLVAHVIRAGKLIAVSAKLSVGERLVGKIAGHSFLAARVLIYVHGMLRTPEKSVVSCQG